MMIYSLLFSVLNRNSGMIVTRGNGSWELFSIMFGLVTLITTEILNNSSIFGEYKNLVFILNTSIIFYLCYKSDWFRNKTVGFYSKLKDKLERLG